MEQDKTTRTFNEAIHDAQVREEWLKKCTTFEYVLYIASTMSVREWVTGFFSVVAIGVAVITLLYL